MEEGSEDCIDSPSYRYWYNKEINVCQEFLYKGCGGNANNFKSRGLCNNKCRVILF